MSRLLLICGMLLLASVEPAAQEPKKTESPKELTTEELDQKLLTEAKIGLDGPALLQFIRSRTVTEMDRKRVQQLIDSLSSEDFETRESASTELLKQGGVAISFLKVAGGHRDPEVVRRAELISRKLTSLIDSRHLLAAVHKLGVTDPPETIPTLFDFLPSTADDYLVVDQILDTLVRLTSKQAKADPRLLQALNSPEASQRIASATILAKALKDQRERVKALLRDNDPAVRFALARVYFEFGDRDVVPVLIALLVEAPPEVAFLVEDLLCRLLGDDPIPASLGRDPESRKICREAWGKWWQAKGDKIDLSQLSKEGTLRGITLVSEMDLNKNFRAGRMFEVGPDGRQLWELKLASAVMDVQRLPGGRLLLAEWATQSVKEYDREGKVHWDSGNTGGSPIFALRLANGNTVVATEGKIFELDRDKKALPGYPPLSGIKHAVRSRNGNLLVLTTTEIVELEPGGKIRQRFTHGLSFGGWGGLELLPNGNYLLADTVGNRVVEIDSKAKIVWEVKQPNPRRTQRLPNGNILIALVSGQCIVEVDRAKKEVGKIPARGGIYGLIRY